MDEDEVVKTSIMGEVKMAVLAFNQSQSMEFFKDKGKTINSFVCILLKC
jgi:hypothetical protein